MRLLPLLLLLACAGGTPTQYAQGVPAPRPPVFSPVTDSPITVGQPGHTGPQALPRSPHKRELPPPGDWPGVWSGDGPKATIQGDYLEIVYDIGIPRPVDKEAEEPLRRCVHLLLDAVNGPSPLETLLLAQPLPERSCAVASMMYQCAYARRRQYESQPMHDEVQLRALKRAEEWAHAIITFECPDATRLSPQWHDLINRWTAAFRLPPP